MIDYKIINNCYIDPKEELSQKVDDAIADKLNINRKWIETSEDTFDNSNVFITDSLINSDIFNPNFIDKERYCFAISKNENKPEVLVTRKKYDNNNMHSRF